MTILRTVSKSIAAAIVVAGFADVAVAQSTTTTSPSIKTPSTTRTAPATPSLRSRVKPFSLNNFRSKGVSVTVTYQLELPSDNKSVDAQIATVDIGRKAFYGAVKRECEVLLELLASECNISTMRVSNNRRTVRGSNSMYISGTATFKLKLK